MQEAEIIDTSGGRVENRKSMATEFSAMIVDDEPWSVLGIKKGFPWAEFGFEIVGETTDAIEAIELICRLEPDAVVTDIRMPSVTGFDLIEAAMHHGVDTEFVLVSGFSDFEYARSALRLGVFDYCLKPVSPSDASALLDRLRGRLVQKLLDRLSPGYDLPHGGGGRFPNDGERIVVGNQAVVCPVDDVGKRIVRMLTGSTTKATVGSGRRSQSVVVQNPADVAPRIKRLIRTLATTNRSEAAAGVSRHREIPTGAGILLREARIASLWHSAGGESVRLYRPFAYPAVDGTLARLVDAIDREQRAAVNEIVAQMGQAEGISDSAEGATVIWNHIAAHVVTRADANRTSGGAFMPFLTVFEVGRRFSSYPEFAEELMGWIRAAWQGDGADPDANSGNERMRSLVRYVDRAFAQPLYLEDLAREYHFNYSYCSELFRQVTGLSFSHYLRSRRIEKAEELLRTTDLKIGEVSEAVGFEDQCYFSRVFSSVRGTSPTTYRKRHAGR